MMIDSAFAISVGIVFSILCALFYALNVFHYKVINDRKNLWFVLALTTMMMSILFSNVAYIASRYPSMDYKGWLSSSAYMPFTKFGVLISILLLIRAFTGEQYPRVWLWCAVVSAVLSLYAYVLLT